MLLAPSNQEFEKMIPERVRHGAIAVLALYRSLRLTVGAVRADWVGAGAGEAE